MIKFYISEAIRSILQSKLASFITVVSLAIAILAANSSIALVLLSNRIDDELKERVEVDIFLNSDIAESDISTVRENLENDNRVQSIQYFSKEEAKAKFIEETGEDFVSILDANPLPSSFRVKFKSERVSKSNIDSFVSDIEKNVFVDEVVYDYSTIISLINFINSSRLMVFAISIVLVILAIYLVYSTNKLQIQNKAEIFNTMKLVGSTLRTLKVPIYITGLVFGLFSALVSFGVLYIIVQLFQKFYYNFNFLNYIYITTFVTVSLGLFFGVLGSYISSRNISLKVKKLK